MSGGAPAIATTFVSPSPIGGVGLTKSANIPITVAIGRDNQIKQESMEEEEKEVSNMVGVGEWGYFPISNIEGYPNFDIFLCLPIISSSSASSSLTSTSVFR